MEKAKLVDKEYPKLDQRCLNVLFLRMGYPNSPHGFSIVKWEAGDTLRVAAFLPPVQPGLVSVFVQRHDSRPYPSDELIQ